MDLTGSRVGEKFCGIRCGWDGFRIRPSRLVQVVRPVVCSCVGHLREMLAGILVVGGEGLIICHPSALGYVAGRSCDALRVTPLTLNIL